MFLILHPWAAPPRDWFALAWLIILFAVLVMPVRRPLWLRFGVIAVDRETQERRPKPSAERLGQWARLGRAAVG